MSTVTGREAERLAADYLKKKHHKILAQNWRSRWCEIDIISQRWGRIYFVEVKYRANSASGSGLEYITPKKLQQMRFAAEFWIAQNRKPAEGYQLAAIELTGRPPEITRWVSNVI